MSILDNFMSRVVDLDEKEKEEVILFLAAAHVNSSPDFLKHISEKVRRIIMPFLFDSLAEKKKKSEGGEKVERVRTGKESEKDQGCRA